jgi:hypothetical protein
VYRWGATGINDNYIAQRLFDASLIAGKKVSCFIRLRSVNEIQLELKIGKYDGTGYIHWQTATFAEQDGTTTIEDDNVWRWYRADIDVTSIEGVTFSADNYTEIRIGNSTSIFTIEIDKVRLIKTPVNLPDNSIPDWVKTEQNYDVEEMRVKQYFQVIYGSSITPSFIAHGIARSTTAVDFTVNIENGMIRTPHTVSLGGTGTRYVTIISNGTSPALTSPTTSNIADTDKAVMFKLTNAAAIFTANQGIYLLGLSTNNIIINSRF